MTAEKIVIIGAGSVQFSMDIVRDLALTEGLQGSETGFVDIDPERLSIIIDLARRYCSEVGADIRFSSTDDRKGAIKDAKIIINTALAGGHQLMENEREIQQGEGYYHGIAVHAPYRQLKLMHDVAKDIEQVGRRDAYLIQSANPIPEGCTIMIRQTSVNAIGLCHGHLEYENILNVLGIPISDVSYEASGINHNIWLTKLRAGEKDIYPEIDRWITEDSENYWRNWNPGFEEMQMSPASIDLYQLYGLMPIGDTCRASWPEAWWYHVDEETKMRWFGQHGGYEGKEGWRLHLEWLYKRQQQIVDAAKNHKIPLITVFPIKKSREQIVPLIDSIINDQPNSFQVNVPNNEAIPGLPSDFVVEIPAIVDAKGVHPQPIEKLPDRIMLGVLYPRWLFAERLIAAYNTGDTRFLLQAYLSDHQTLSREQAIKTLDLIVAMPGNEEMAEKVREFEENNSIG